MRNLNYDGPGTRCSLLASKVLDKIHNTVAVAIFIIIPGKKDRQNFEYDFPDLAYEQFNQVITNRGSDSMNTNTSWHIKMHSGLYSIFTPSVFKGDQFLTPITLNVDSQYLQRNQHKYRYCNFSHAFYLLCYTIISFDI